ncbi:MAG: hypothetical protein PHH43_06575 [Candidatus Cloacimonetes bacterium]|nr:hypothetical protein [Candidatus Cloacimonadota bacterium]MDD3235976.1 hypothetical protein [Candidatus Cloacimonadota bacterium]
MNCPIIALAMGIEWAMIGQFKQWGGNGVANSDLTQHLQDAFQTASLSLPIRRLAAQ